MLSYLELRQFASEYLSEQELAILDKAYAVAHKGHNEQYRQSGEPYITHPLAVAYILIEHGMDIETLCGALLHDVLEDTDYTYAQIHNKFGEAITLLVDGVSKLRHLADQNYTQQEFQNLLKMLQASSTDWRVLAIKLADRLHNMRTIGCMKLHKQQRKARETLEVYAPLSGHLGLFTIKKELEDLSFTILHPYRHLVITKAIEKYTETHITQCQKMILQIQGHIISHSTLKETKVILNRKSSYEIYLERKIDKRALRSQEHILSIHCIVTETENCYLLLGLIHALWPPIFDAFRDYIGMPKINSYQALHTAVRMPSGKTIAIIIQTDNMRDAIYTHASEKERKIFIDHPLDWSRILQVWEGTEELNRNGLKAFKHEISRKQILIFDYAHHKWGISEGCTALDFAYCVDSKKAPYCSECSVNDQKQPLSQILKNGDFVTFRYDNSLCIHPTWLNFATSAKAKVLIKRFLHNERIKNASFLGRLLVKTISDKYQYHPCQNVMKNYSSETSFFEAIGIASLDLNTVFPALNNLRDFQIHLLMPAENVKYLAVAAKCCHPYAEGHVCVMVNTDKKWVLHTLDCQHAPKKDRVHIEWSAAEVTGCFGVKITLSDQMGALAKITKILEQHQAQIIAIDTLPTADIHERCVRIFFCLKDFLFFSQVLVQLRRLPFILHLERASYD